MAELMVSVFGGLLMIAIASALFSSFLFTNARPAVRAAITATAAFLVCTLGTWWLDSDLPGATFARFAIFFAPMAVVTFLLMWWGFRLYWIEDDAEAEAQATPDPVDVQDDGGGFVYVAPAPTRNYLLRHWRGECRLPVAYWVNATLIVFAAVLLLALVPTTLQDHGFSLQLIAIAALVRIFGSLLIWAWGVVGVWRSATVHEDRGGSGFWAILAQVMVALGAVGTFVELRGQVLQAQEYAVLAVGGDPLGEAGTVTVSKDGAAVHIEGMLTSGISQRFADAIAGRTALRTVTLSSPGGRHLEGVRIADTIRARGFDTRVEEQCLSACTFILLSGRDRTARPYAPIGFHQPDFPGWSRRDQATAIAEAGEDYRRAGVDADFVEEAMSVPPEGIWLPSHERMESAKVLTATEIIVGGR